jgi:transglutaminase-like putative cysteine protease
VSVSTIGSVRLRIVHRTGFRYEKPVSASYNEARLTPLTTPTQTTLEARVEVSPVTWTSTYWDYWGSQVTSFEVLSPHTELIVVARSTVETVTASEPSMDAGWATLRSNGVADGSVEWLTQTRFTQPSEEVAALAREAAGDLAPGDAARAVADSLRDRLEYRPGVTGVYSTAQDVWQARSGVCQDFAHLTIGALRALGIPARYVSGYQHPRALAEVGETVQGESHAWLEWWAGEWYAYDPTSAVPAGENHVTVARGRDYADVSPLKGVYSGPSSSSLFVSVEVTRVA